MIQPLSPTELDVTAHHEAGHAIANFVFGFGVEEVTIAPDTAAGRVRRRATNRLLARDRSSPDTPGSREALQNEVVVCLAGAETQARFLGLDVESIVHTGDVESDFQHAEMLVDDLVGPWPSVAEGLFAYLGARAQQLVEIHWFLVDALAKELVVRPTLSGTAVNRVLRDAMREEFLRTEDSNPDWDSFRTRDWQDLALQLGMARVFSSGDHRDVELDE